MPKPNDLTTLIDLAQTTQSLLAHFTSSLAPTPTTTTQQPPPPSISTSTTAPASTTPLTQAKACTTLLKSHTTTLSLLLLTPPLTPSALITKISDVSSGPLSALVGAAVDERRCLGSLMRGELRAQVRRVLASWGEVVGLVVRVAEGRRGSGGGGGKGKGKEEGGLTEGERGDVLAATGVVWEACDAVGGLCEGGVVGLVVRRAEEWRGLLVDAVEELKEWGEDVDGGEDGEDDKAEGSDGGVEDEDDMFGAANKLGKGDTELKEVLDKSVKKVKMVAVLYQALIKRRLKTFPEAPATAVTNGEGHVDPTAKLDELMALLKNVPESVDDLASAFYDLDEEEAKATLEKCCGEAKSAVDLVKQNWVGKDDEFTAWSTKWVDALDAA